MPASARHPGLYEESLCYSIQSDSLSDGPTLSEVEMEECVVAEHSLELCQGAQEALDHLSLAEAPLFPRVAAAGRPASRSTHLVNFSLAPCMVMRTSSFRASRPQAAVPGLPPPLDDHHPPSLRLSRFCSILDHSCPQSHHMPALTLVQYAIRIFQRSLRGTEWLHSCYLFTFTAATDAQT